MARFRYVVCDVFTDTPLEGNQLAVFTDARELPEETLQPLAREMNFSETVFVYPAGADAHARIRIFTPASEIPFAGHPTLGTAFVLGGPLQLGEIRLETGVGVVPVTLEREGARIVFGRMSQPLPSVEPFGDEAALLAALGVERSELPVELYDNGLSTSTSAWRSPADVAALKPDFERLAECGALCVSTSPARARRGRRGCSLPASASPRIRRPARRPGRCASTSSATAASRRARRSRSRRASRSRGPSKLYARVDGSAGEDRARRGGRQCGDRRARRVQALALDGSHGLSELLARRRSTSRPARLRLRRCPVTAAMNGSRSSA